MYSHPHPRWNLKSDLTFTKFNTEKQIKGNLREIIQQIQITGYSTGEMTGFSPQQINGFQHADQTHVGLTQILTQTNQPLKK